MSRQSTFATYVNVSFMVHVVAYVRPKCSIILLLSIPYLAVITQVPVLLPLLFALV